MVRLLPLFMAVLAQPVFAAKMTHLEGPLKEFKFAVTWSKYDLLGFTREGFFINGESPGPVIEVDQYDWVKLEVQNDSPHSISVHFHGLEMLHTPWADGVPGVTQWPIEPNNTFTYEFQARQYGGFWYHAHYRGQIEDGMYGAIVVHPEESSPKPFKQISDKPSAIAAMVEAERQARPLLISDWMHMTSTERWDITLASNLELSCYDALLFNGKGNIECLKESEITANINQIQRANLNHVPGAVFTDKGCLPASVMGTLGDPVLPLNLSAIPKHAFEGCKETKGNVEVITVPESKDPEERWVAIHLIIATNFVRAAVSIDEHDMWIFAVDSTYIKPQKVQAAIVASGERYSVLVKTSKVGDFKIRVNSAGVPQMLTGHALLSVGGHKSTRAVEVNSKPHIDIVGKGLSRNVTFWNATKAKSFQIRPIPKSADDLFVLSMVEDGASYLWALNETRLMPDDFEDSTPVLVDPLGGMKKNLTITTLNGTWVDLVIITYKYPFPPHPIHKHGNKVFQIGAGTGRFKWASVDEAVKEKPEYFNLEDPLPRDTFASPQARDDIAWIVVRYHSINPGPWMLHCHIANHMMGGMSMIIQDGVDAWPELPEKYTKNPNHR